MQAIELFAYLRHDPGCMAGYSEDNRWEDEGKPCNCGLREKLGAMELMGTQIEGELLDAAMEALTIATEDGRAKYEPYAWRNPEHTQAVNRVHCGVHVMEAMVHIYEDLTAALKQEQYVPDDQEDHLAHAICRLVIAYARRNEGLA